MEQIQKKPRYLTLPELKTKWNEFAGIYSAVDNSMNIFFYELIHMLQLDTAKNIYEVGCGTGRLIPYVMSIKNRQATYLGVDISENMIEMAKQTVRSSLKSIPVLVEEDSYYKMNHLILKCGDGQKQMHEQAPFDRILCNLVLMITQDPTQMMNNFYRQAQEGCLLGVTVAGNTQANNFLLSLPQKIKKRLGIPVEQAFVNHVLYNKLKELGEQTGWQLLVSWEQTVPYTHFGLDQKLVSMLKEWHNFSKGIYDELLEEIKNIFSRNQTLNFPGQLAVFRRKQNNS